MQLLAPQQELTDYMWYCVMRVSDQGDLDISLDKAGFGDKSRLKRVKEMVTGTWDRGRKRDGQTTKIPLSLCHQKKSSQ